MTSSFVRLTKFTILPRHYVKIWSATLWVTSKSTDGAQHRESDIGVSMDDFPTSGVSTDECLCRDNLLSSAVPRV
jgi:hypothetical protein